MCIAQAKSACAIVIITLLQGRGIVTVGGGLRYIVPAWINVHQLRHMGCKLPIEMWYPLSEYPTQPVIDAFARLGVTTRPLDFKVWLPGGVRRGAPWGLCVWAGVKRVVVQTHKRLGRVLISDPLVG